MRSVRLPSNCILLRRDGAEIPVEGSVAPIRDREGQVTGAVLVFRDVSDHVRRVQEEIDGLREVLAFTFEASLMSGQAQQTAITRKLAAWAAILAVPTAIAGLYGMNFEHMPELKWQYGYYMVLAIIAGVCGLLYARFRRYGWL